MSQHAPNSGSDLPSGALSQPSETLDIARQLIETGWDAFIPSVELHNLSLAALSAARMVFSLPAQEKQRFHHPEWQEQVGWSQSTRLDRPVELWQLRGSVWPGDWPSDLHAELQTLGKLGARCEAMTQAVVDELRVLLDPADVGLPDHLDHEQTVIRLLHYRARPSSPGFGPHTDPGLVTVFAGETSTGLQLAAESGEWVTPHQRWVAAAGEMISACTNGKIRPALHQVSTLKEERWAIAVFVHPEPSFPICSDEHGMPVTARAFFELLKPNYAEQHR